MSKRVYPIRLSRPKWKIPLYSIHKCNKRCKKIIGNIDDNFILIDNPTYDIETKKCEMSDKIQDTDIRIISFNHKNPCGFSGPLYGPDMIVIPDKFFQVTITYPLYTRAIFSIRASNSAGFTIRDVIYSIRKVYEYIYAEEERTATPQTYKIKQNCICNMYSFDNYVKPCKKTLPKTEECSICYNTYNKKMSAYSISCEHSYHKACIEKWMETAKTCPLCRDVIRKCEKCNSSGFIFYDYNGIVIPIFLRGNISNRNITNGVYQIWGHDLDDLYLEGMEYDRIKKELNIIIGS